MINVDTNTKQTLLYKNYKELVEFLHSSDVDCLMDSAASDLPEMFDTYQDLLEKNPL